jgi:hypothetical protein
MLKKIFLLILLFSICELQSQTLNSRNLPLINVIALNNHVFEAGKLSIKLHRNQFKNLQVISSNNNEIIFNHGTINQLSQAYHFTKYKQLFETALQFTELQTQHYQYNLDLWYSIEFDTMADVKKLFIALQKTNLFEVVEPVYKKHLLVNDEKENAINFIPNDPQFNDQWAFNNTGQGNGKAGKDIKLTDAWDIETGKPNVVVAVMDMGIQLDHPDLAQNIAVGKSYNFIDNNSLIVPGYHGTHTAGTIAAINNNGIGVSSIAGGNGNVNSGVRLMSMQVFTLHASGGFAESFVYAADNGACISSNSWAYDDENIYELATMDAIDYFIETAGGSVLQGGLVIFASGNVSRTIQYYPSAYDRVICVAATNNRDTKANYSTFGSWVDITAPGGDFNDAWHSQILSTTVNGGYSYDHGTSMACPHVAGVAALIASKLAGRASASDVRDILLSTTDNIDSLNPNFIGLLGSGRLNAYKALSKAEAIANSIIILGVDSFKATNNCININLHWKKNNIANDVVIAYSNKNNIGSLVNGKKYHVGDHIVGEATIIYKGKANDFAMTNNNKMLHFFKIWSTNASNNYSYGKTAEIVAPAYIQESGSIQQNFNFAPLFPTQEWRTINPDNDISWIHTVQDTAHTGAGDLYSMCMYNYSYNTKLGAVDILTSPIINIQNSDSLNLSFWNAYQYRNTGLSVSDSFEVLVSNDCGNTFTSLWKNGGTNLATSSSTSDSAFYPFDINKWKKVNVNLQSYINNDKLMFAFRSVNGKGNNLFLDNINIDVRYKRDVELLKIVSPIDATCNNNIIPQILIKNRGNNTITSLKISYTIDGESAVTTNWIGNIGKEDSTIIQLNASTTNAGNHQIIIYSYLPNNLNDEYVLNDTIHSVFFITPVAVMPLLEGFEGNNFPPQNWFINQQPNDAISWSTTNLAAKTGNTSCVLQNFLYDNEGYIDDLITPFFNIDKKIDSAFLLFDYAHATRSIPTNSSLDFDTLEIDISKDCGSTWTRLWKKGGTDLQTINQTAAYDIEFIPKINQWKSDSMMISGGFNIGDKIQIRFRNIVHFGNNIYLDNIHFYTKYDAPGIKEKGYAIYPNPVDNFLTIQHLNTPTNLNAIRVINSIGKRMMTVSYASNAAKDILLNTSSLASGIYVLQLIYNDKTITEKFIKMR